MYANLHAAGAILGGAIPWKEKSGTGISVATGYAAAEAILAPAAHAGVGGGAMNDAHPRLARPLRQVHDLRDVLSGLPGHTALPRAQVRRTPGGAVSRRGTVGGRIGRLLLGLRHLHAGLPAGREDRGDQFARAREALGAARHPASQPDDRPTDGDRTPRDSGRAAGQLGAPQSRGSRTGAERHRHPSRRADAELRRQDVSATVTQAPSGAGRTHLRSSTSTGAAPTTTSRSSARWWSRSSNTTGFG